MLCSCGTASVTPSTDDYSQDEAVNIGYSRARKRDLTGSVSKLTLKDEELVGYSDIYEYLQGRVAGVEVVGTQVRVRGEHSITGNNDPLWIVDGQECNDVGSIPVNMIKSVEVLKDGSLTAMYGSRGANGVILVTLKDGN